MPSSSIATKRDPVALAAELRRCWRATPPKLSAIGAFATKT